jgi:hypothetical protein
MDYYFILFAAISSLLAALAVKPSPYRWLFFPLTIGFSVYYSLYFQNATDDSFTNEALRSTSTILIVVASDFILLTDVQRELHQIGQREPISKASLMARCKWAFQLYTGNRGVGWAHEPTSVLPPRPANVTRFQFITSRLFWLARCVLIVDAASVVVRAKGFAARDELPFAEQPLPWRCVNTLVFCIVSGLNITISHTCLSILAVGSGLSPPDMWPHIMGRWDDAYTIRRFWG